MQANPQTYVQATQGCTVSNLTLVIFTKACHVHMAMTQSCHYGVYWFASPLSIGSIIIERTLTTTKTSQANKEHQIYLLIMNEVKSVLIFTRNMLRTNSNK